MSKLSRIVFAALFATSLTLLSCCSKQATTISIGINSWPGYEFLYLAKSKGLYQKHGVEVKLVAFNSLADARQAFELGHLDGIACTLMEHCQILDKSDRSPRIATVLDYSEGADLVIAREGIDSIDQLVGKRVGLEAESLGVFILSRLLDHAGLELEAVTPVKSDQLSLKHLMETGEIDAAITYPPHSLAILNLPGCKTIFSSADIPNEVVDVLIFDESVVAQHESAVRSVISAIYEAQEWSQKNADVAYAIMAEREGISPAAFAAILNDGIHITFQEEQEKFFKNEKLLDAALQTSDSILRKTKQLQNPQRYEGTVSPDLYLGSQ